MHMVGAEGVIYKSKPDDDIEVVAYPIQNVLCFQPHPEMTANNSSCTRYFFELIERELEIK
jgi:GMP synthase-like glutamine amidotransferase